MTVVSPYCPACDKTSCRHIEDAMELLGMKIDESGDRVSEGSIRHNGQPWRAGAHTEDLSLGAALRQASSGNVFVPRGFEPLNMPLNMPQTESGVARAVRQLDEHVDMLHKVATSLESRLGPVSVQRPTPERANGESGGPTVCELASRLEASLRGLGALYERLSNLNTSLDL